MLSRDLRKLTSKLISGFSTETKMARSASLEQYGFTLKPRYFSKYGNELASTKSHKVQSWVEEFDYLHTAIPAP